jgi:hypothetical protein
VVLHAEEGQGRVSLYIIGGLVLLLLAALWYAHKTGKKVERASSLEAAHDRDREAAKIVSEVNALSDDGVRSELRKRVRRPF